MIKNTLIKLFILGSLFVQVANAEQLTATIIGSGSPIYNENRASASVLISNGETNILVDMGNGTQTNLHKLGFASRNLSSLFFTHHHLDHNEEFVPILISSLMGTNDFSIVGPPNTSKLTQVNLDLYQEDIAYRLGKSERTLDERKKAFTVTDIKGGESFSVGEISVSTIEVPHTIHTIAYRFDYDGQSIVVTGDLSYSEDLPTLAKNADYMIIDSGGMIMSDGRANKRKKVNSSSQGNVEGNAKRNNKNGQTPAHLDLADSSTLAAKSQIKNLVYTHFNSSIVNTEASLKEIRKNYQGNVIFSEDLMVINDLPNSIAVTSASTSKTNSYAIVDTGQVISYNDKTTISAPSEGDIFFGQDASYIINHPSYTDNHDGTILDNVTGLMWQQALTEKLTYDDAIKKVAEFNLAGYSDWRIATIKELYSLIQFTGTVKGEKALTPFIDTNYFTQPLGDTNQGEREIDAQVWSSTEFVGKTMKNDDTVFGVNFVDGRIKGYPKYDPRTHEANKMYFRLVRDNDSYGENSFIDNGDGTITDKATGLMWQKADSQKGLNWQDALQYSENLSLAGHDDWRVPNAKELQSIVDYTRSPATSNSATIASIFEISSIKNEAGENDYPYFWSSTTHLDGPVPESNAVYIAFGKALGNMHNTIMDVHGAGAQRSDPKTGEAMSRGPQGDYIRVSNYVRSVRGGVIDTSSVDEATTIRAYTVIENNSINNAVKKPAKGPQKPAGAISHSMPKNQFINRLDKDGDGKVSKAEFKRNEAQFNHFDKNKDGYIDAEEAPTGPPKKTNTRMN